MCGLLNVPYNNIKTWKIEETLQKTETVVIEHKEDKRFDNGISHLLGDLADRADQDIHVDPANTEKI